VEVIMQYVFGPVPSRRLGQSLGIDPVPMKTCNWNCVYCQLGHTSPPSNQRADFAPVDDVIAEVQEALGDSQEGEIDWLTIVGSGEPTLNAHIGELIARLKSLSRIPVAVLTNGSLLYQPEVRREISGADAILPSLDAGSELLYRKINRALPELSWQRLVEGLIAFRSEYAGHLWVEVMLIKDLNDSDSALEDLARVLTRIKPDEVHLVLPERPPCEPWVAVAEKDRIARAAEILGAVTRVVLPTAGAFKVPEGDDVLDTVAAIIARHPMSEVDLVRALETWNADQVHEALRQLEKTGRAQLVTRHDERYWSGIAARYVKQPMSRCQGEPPSTPEGWSN
jgi:wyosine [tRNA(Phe)-imidazoG37] synthetase (radical SAM superfamily)